MKKFKNLLKTISFPNLYVNIKLAELSTVPYFMHLGILLSPSVHLKKFMNFQFYPE